MKIAVVLLLAALPLPVFAQPQLPAPATAKVDYVKDVKPLLAEHCYSCHGDTVQQAGLRLDLRQNALRGGDYGPVIVPGRSAESKLIKRLVDGDGGMQMPPAGALSAEDIGLLRAWIDQGPEFVTEVAERPARPIDPRLASVIAAVRGESRPAVEAAVGSSLELVKSADPGGSTLLHHAAGFGSLDTLVWLLERGADVNAKNRRASTPLHWAVHDGRKVRELLKRGASVNARQAEGRTPLLLAAMLGDGLDTIRVLLEAGADPAVATANGQTPLMAAAVRGDVAAMQLLVDKRADVNAKNGAGETALMLAATNDHARGVRFLLERGADARARSKRNETALGNAATAGNDETVRVLLEHGAEINVRNIRGFSPLMHAAGSDAVPDGVVKLLLSRGADTSYTGDYDETARDLAAKRGDTEVARLLGAQPARLTPVASLEHAPVGPAAAVEKALTLLERQSDRFIRTAGCNSCHSQDLPSAAAAFARSRGARAPKTIPQLPESMTVPAERVMDFGYVALSGVVWELFDAGMNGAPRSAFTDAVVRAIKAMQTSEGYWPGNESRRPPMNAGEYQAAALAVYALVKYGPPSERADTERAIAKAVAWLKRGSPTSTQDRAFHALALAWGGAADAAQSSARELIAMQRADGGWSQMPTLASDAYATGQVLFALHEAGRLAVSDPVYRKGVDYLLRTQAADGSWLVKSRSIWLQPYFESGFPYGQDQFISAAGTAWASFALAATIPSPVSTRREQ